eukprot:5517454-Alexandrium_andersonii.AAC.1
MCNLSTPPTDGPAHSPTTAETPAALARPHRNLRPTSQRGLTCGERPPTWARACPRDSPMPFRFAAAYGVVRRGGRQTEPRRVGGMVGRP